jgi:hypothetical protein
MTLYQPLKKGDKVLLTDTRSSGKVMYIGFAQEDKDPLRGTTWFEVFIPLVEERDGFSTVTINVNRFDVEKIGV